jgi:hypothetical protein
MIKNWLEQCQGSHSTSCQQAWPSPLPTRVINVGVDQEPYLMITQGENSRYLALSHRWGPLDLQYHGSVTTKQTLEQHCDGIPMSSLPLTFRQAVEVTRALGIQYLWIDSLCILQNDKDDCEREASLMGDVFANAYATLFAERSSHSDDGLFPNFQETQLLQNWIHEVKHYDPVSKRHQWVLISSGMAYYPSCIEVAFCLVDKAQSHLRNRGWICRKKFCLVGRYVSLRRSFTGSAITSHNVSVTWSIPLLSMVSKTQLQDFFISSAARMKGSQKA